MFSTNVLPIDTPWPSGTDSPNTSAPLSSSPPLQPSTRSFGEAVPSFPQRAEPIQSEALYPAQNGPYIQHSVMEEEDDERDGDSTSPSFPPKIDKAKPNRQREPKVLTGKQFPVKVFEMLEDETATNFIKWSKSGTLDAFYIPDTKAFEVNVMPKHFKEMKQWGSFQRQLHNYGFKKRDRGAGKALYAHSENKFRKGRPDLLSQVLRKQNCRMKALIGRDSSPARERAPSPIVPATPQSISQIDRSTNENQLEHGNEQLGTSILELKRAIELSGARLWALEEQGKAAADRLKVTEDLFKVAADRLKATEDRLKATEDRFKTIEDRLLLMQSQSTQPSRTLETLSMGDDRPRVPLGLRLPLHLDQDHTWTLPFILHCTLDSIPRQIIINPQVATNTSANTTHQLQPFYLKSATNSSQVAFSERFRGNETTQPPILSWVLVPMVIVSEHPVTTAVPRPILHELVFYIYSKNYRADKQRREQD